MSALFAAGFDLVHPFDPLLAAWLDGPETVGHLIGNTRALWEPFSAALARDPELAAEHDPLDRYTERTIEAAYPGRRILFAHRPYEGAFLPFGQLAVDAGLAALAPTHLLVHPIHGPWFALRAIALLPGEPPLRVTPIAKPCRCEAAGCESALATAIARSDDRDAWLAVRDRCTIRASRYSEPQIRFHYTRAWESRRQTPR